ncbi:MAG: bifunctional demethylmenaquinone methyltransferase/2-methoxy-6-polyprenyl-1,4-benzoquinol methylase [Hyphomicrobiales bacterium]|nr:MAG: bifunctional demethylmenaquinone methyltransferase/2-methoxy-6-polyprenyl-1,4-benzoquinol methylase [Hyphomicrobiales bacterium]
MDDLSGRFGRERVEPQERRQRIRSLFNAIAPRYDLMNDLMSGGTHRLWKARFTKAAAAAVGNASVLDLAGGTGDIALGVLKHRPDAAIVICDPSTGMLGVAVKRDAAAYDAVAAEGETLPFGDESFGVVTLSFGLRNMTDPQCVIDECLRVLRPGGQLFILEFSQPVWWFAPAYRLYSRIVIPALGALVAGHRGAYRYLVESIAGFPDAETVSQTLLATGFGKVTADRLFFGIAAIHVAAKPDG